jgi:hypothetical protein
VSQLVEDMPRPEPWDSYLPRPERLPRGSWAVVPDGDWRLDSGHRCRYGSPAYGWCGEPSVAALRRGRRKVSWWAYCARHLYGRWIEGGRVVDWEVVR